jgi:hypothetical protein
LDINGNEEREGKEGSSEGKRGNSPSEVTDGDCRILLYPSSRERERERERERNVFGATFRQRAAKLAQASAVDNVGYQKKKRLPLNAITVRTA